MAKQSLKVKEKLAPLDTRASQDFFAQRSGGKGPPVPREGP